MSKFAVTIERVATVKNHPNADRLDLATVEGMEYQFIVGRNQLEVGNLVVYFPLDAILPESLLEILGLVGKLSGANKNRVKTIKLRQQISQGVIAPASLFFGKLFLDDELYKVGADVTKQLGVIKYNSPVKLCDKANLHPLPDFVGKYDIENAERYQHLVNLLMNRKVYISEKLEGSHWGCCYYPKSEKFYVLQRNYRIEPLEDSEHAWIRVANEGQYKEKLKQIVDELDWNLQCITLRGEIVGPGIQGNYYKLDGHQAYAFEIEVNGCALSANTFINFCNQMSISRVPELWFGELGQWLCGDTLQEASNGTSRLVDRPREGIVIKPLIETSISEIGRLFLKQRSPKYLLKADC
jgi:RNA ligase (TIGR02306 family)